MPGVSHLSDLNARPRWKLGLITQSAPFKLATCERKRRAKLDLEFFSAPVAGWLTVLLWEFRCAQRE